MYKIALLCLSFCFLLSCSNDDDSTTDVNIRLSNVSELDYENIIVNTSTGNINFGDLKSGSSSAFQTFELAYRYAFVQLNINGETFTLQPIDYVGETPLSNGNYTYQINYNDTINEFGELELTLVRE